MDIQVNIDYEGFVKSGFSADWLWWLFEITLPLDE
jgi:hypothetical protein